MNARESQSEHPGLIEAAYRGALASLAETRAVERLFRCDPTLWKPEPEHQAIARNRLGWLDSPRWLEGVAPELAAFAAEIRAEGFTRVLLLGMGGSSLAPEVLARLMKPAPGAPTLDVLDSTDPAAIRSAETSHRLDRTFFVVASKSGRTVETLSQYRYFRARLDATGGGTAARQFAVITDAGSALERVAREEGVRRVFLNPADIGGRYSALSHFGMVPAALMGVDVRAFAADASRAMVEYASEDPKRNGAIRLGAFLGAAARAGKDKLTLLAPPPLRPLGYWIEQLVAESTGKEGAGIVPVEGEPPGFARYYSDDRCFVSITLESAPSPEIARLGAELRQAGAPWIEIALANRGQLAAEFYRWEVATATAAALLRVNPFDEPNVQESKDRTTAILARFEKSGALPGGAPRTRDQGVEVYAPDPLWERIAAGAPGHPSLEMILGRFLALRKPGDYLALLAFVERTAGTEASFAHMRREIRDALRIATLQGYGPRYLHSIGQLYKGGADRGLYLFMTAADETDIPIPESRVTFGQLKTAQALGDLDAL
ncbi:MAG: transaldolase, partial [Candidatus Latescibacteria bacterium]|nr:transaldolase [Candidatus Latescibacterota bacterium]